MTRSLLAFARASLLFVLPTVLLCVGMLEAGLRMMGDVPSNTTDGFFEQHGTAYRLRKNATKISRTPSYSCTIYTDARGFRASAPGSREFGPGPYVAFVGDSLTFGNGVEFQDSFVGVFAQRGAQSGLGVVNLAVGGHHLSEQEDLLLEFISSVPKEPDWVFIVFTPQFMELFESRYTDVLVRNGYIFRRSDWLIPYLTVALGNSSSAYNFFRDGIRRTQARLMPSTTARVALGMLAPFSRTAPLASKDVAERFETRLARLDEEIRRAGSRPFYVYMPSSADVRTKEFLEMTGRDAAEYDFLLYLRLLRRHCERSGVPLVDMLPVVQRLHEEMGELSFPQDMHYNAGASRAIGEALYALTTEHMHARSSDGR
jgi:hypothetical protein